MTRPETITIPPAERRVELRLALVCYGGVSLAVYMHGVTRELHALVRASRAFDGLPDLAAANPFAPDQTEHAYVEALRTLARQGRALSVTIDVIAGTSAGGINGVVLAKALACNASQDALKRLWIEQGDLRRLLRGLPFGPLRLRAASAALRLLLRLRSNTSPLRGEVMSSLLHEALQDMDRTAQRLDPAASRTLLPREGSLDLLVTLTDLHGFEVLVPTGAGGASQRDRAHAQVLRFTADPEGPGGLGEQATAQLAFAARATASFPGAFAPVSIASFERECGARLEPDDLSQRFRYDYRENGVRAADAWFVDGGVLDNAPFDLVVEAVSRKPAQSEVVRRLVYVQPDPGRPLDASDHEQGARSSTWLGDTLEAVVGVKGSHGVLRDLEALRDLNLQIAEVGAIAGTQTNGVLDALDELLGQGGWALDAKPDLEHAREEMNAAARTRLGAGYPTYWRLKVEAAARRFADELAPRVPCPPDSSRASLVRAALGAWARSSAAWNDVDPARLVELLGPVDVPYRERRLMFLLAGVNELYAQVGSGPGAPSRADLDGLKQCAWSLLDGLRRTPGEAAGDLGAEDVAFLSEGELDVLADPEQLARDHADDFARLFRDYRAALVTRLGDGSTPLWEAYEQRTRSWDGAHRRRLLSRYLGFPLWDGLIFPTVALSRLPQFTSIGVAQFSPLAAGALTAPEKGKLQGVPLHHFAGFVQASYRENDYLWGRLDAVELVLRTLFDAGSERPAAPGTPASPADAVASAGGVLLQQGLRAVLASETGLRRITGTRDTLAEQVEALPVVVDLRDGEEGAALPDRPATIPRVLT